MLENIYTTKMSAERKQLQSRFTKIRSHSSKLSKIAASVTAVVIAVTFVCATVVMAAFNNGEDTEPITLYANGEIISLENKPFIQDNVTYFPLRETLAKLGVFEIEGNELVWDNGTIYLTVAETADSVPVGYALKIGSDTIGFRHEKDAGTEMKAQPLIGVNLKLPDQVTRLVNGKTYVPYTFIDYMLNRGLGIKNRQRSFDFVFTVNGEAPGAFISSGFVWPCEGEISNPFRERENPVTGKVTRHNGIDIAAAEGTEVNAAISGTVTETGYDAERGYFLIIEKDNIQTVYANLTQDIQVKEGDELFKGQSIGEVGNTGTSTGAHLHFEVLINEEYYNPELIF